MSWGVTIVKDPNDKSVRLGSRQEVIDAFAKCTPSIELFKPDVPPPEMLAIMPEILRESALRADLEAIFDDEEQDVYLHFYCSDEPEIRFVNAEVQGDGNPMPILKALCLPNGWSLLDENGPQIDLDAETARGWEKFRSFSDAAFGEREQETDEE